MDLVSNPDNTKVIVVMDHVAKGGKHKILDGESDIFVLRRKQSLIWIVS
jgi:acyl CoA:acetate/3-ketoacid CoA transferase beta subunit